MEFKFIESTTTFECESTDRDWRISGKQASADGDNMFLTCIPLLLTPHGSGSSTAACLKSFICECDNYIERVLKYKKIAQEYLDSVPDKSVDGFLSEHYHKGQE